MKARFDLTEGEWSIIAALLPNKPRGKPRQDDRRVLNGIFYTLRTGSPWGDPPERYGPCTNLLPLVHRGAAAGLPCRPARHRGPGYHAPWHRSS
jgi:transposase